jgi:hypothetical protein
MTASVFGADAAAAFTIDCDFPGGNIIVEKVEGDHVYVCQDLRDTEGNWFYWNFRVRGAAGRTLTFHFKNDVFTRQGPCCSLDGGRTWQWLGMPKAAPAPAKPAAPTADPRLPAGASQESPKPAGPKPSSGPVFTYAIPAGADDVRFALSIPYQESNLREFLARYEGRPGIRTGVLCQTRKGRSAEVLYLGRLDGRPDYRVAFTCRHHACESVASYVLEGIMASVLADDDLGQWFRRRVAILAVPFMDKDGVELGDQGKNRKPHDHNRDYAGDSIHPEVAALKKLLPEWSAGRIDVAIDLHCPSRLDDFIHFVGGAEADFWDRALRLCRILEEGQQGPLHYAMSDNIPFGQGWNKSTGNLMSFGRWARTLPGISVATSIEFPYAQAKKTPVTADGVRAFGRDMAVALRKYLEKELPRN